MALVEGRHPEPPPGVVLVSIFRGISGEPLEWGCRCAAVVDTVHLAAVCEGVDCGHIHDGPPVPRWDVVSVHRDQLEGKKIFKVGDFFFLRVQRRSRIAGWKKFFLEKEHYFVVWTKNMRFGWKFPKESRFVKRSVLSREKRLEGEGDQRGSVIGTVG